MKTVLITGASGGVGLSLANKLLNAGYFVILHYFKNREKLEILNQKYPNNSIIVQADLRSEEAVLQLVQFLDRKKLAIDVLVNNAGIDHVSEIEDKNVSTFVDVFLTNTVGPFLMMKYLCPTLKSHDGVIINISSDNTIDKFDPVTMEYDVSKVGLNMLTREFAILYPDLKINALCFGWIDSEMNNIPEDIKKELKMLTTDEAADRIIESFETKESGKIELVREK